MSGGPPAKRSTLPFFALTFALTWGFQLPAALAHRGLLPIAPERLLPLVGLGVFGPLLGALLAARFEPGGPGARALLRQLRASGAGAGWYLAALAMPGALFAAGKAVYLLIGGDEPGPWVYFPTAPERLVALVLLPLSEEIGWRGYALPRLQRRHGAVPASLLLGAAWALWHIPMFVLADLPPVAYALAVLFFPAGSVAFSWLYNRSGGSLLVAVAAHAGAHLSNTHLALPGDVKPFFVQTVAYVVVAFALVLGDRKAWPAAAR